MVKSSQNLSSEFSKQKKSDSTHIVKKGKTPSEKQKKIHPSNATSDAKSKKRKEKKKAPEDKRTSQQRSDDSARFLCLVVIQGIARNYNQSIYLYCMMLEILLDLCFSADQHTVCKVAISIFHIVGKYMSKRSPPISKTLQWAKCGVKIQEVVNCEGQILNGINFELFELVRNHHLSYKQIQALCYQYQKKIFEKSK